MAMMQPPGEVELATRQDLRLVDQKVDSLGAKVDQLGAKVDQLGERIDRLEERIDRLESRFDRLEEKIDAMLTVMREHMASKADVERMGRLVAMWSGTASVAIIIALLSRS